MTIPFFCKGTAFPVEYSTKEILFVIDISTDPSPHIGAGELSADMLSCQCVVHLYAVESNLFLMYHHHLQSRAVGHQVAHVHGISMSETSAIDE